MNDKYRIILLSKYELEYRINIPQIKCLYHILSDPTNIKISISENLPLLLTDIDKWKKWVKSIKSTKYKYQLKIKPFPYSSPLRYKSISVSLGFELTPSNKLAPDKPIPEFSSNELSRKRVRRQELFDK